MNSMRKGGMTEGRKWKKELDDFEWRSIEVTKEYKKRRAKRDTILAVKERGERKIVEWKEDFSKDILEVRIRKENVREEKC